MKRIIKYFGLTILANLCMLLWTSLFTNISVWELFEAEYLFFQNSFALILSLAAIIIALDDVVQTRIHNRLSVKPHLLIELIGSTSKDISVSIKNGGVGPAIILKFDVYVDDILYSGSSGLSLLAIFRVIKIYDRHSIRSFEPNDLIAAGESITIFKVFHGANVARHNLNLSKMARIRVHLVYKSLYDEINELNQYLFPEFKMTLSDISKTELMLNSSGMS